MTPFQALLVTQTDGKFDASMQKLQPEALPPGEVLIRVAYSSLNYKDGLAVTGKPGVIRSYPMVPGIDLAGVVEESSSSQFKRGDDIIVPVPKGMTLKQAMGVGTAGFTAMQSVVALEQHGLKPGGRKVIVTGAA